MLDIFLKWLIPFLCGGVMTGLAVALKNAKKKNTALENGLQCLLRAEIIRSHERYMEKGWCSVNVKEALEREYGAYSALGGNDVATELYHEMLELPSAPPHTRGEENESI